MTDDDTHDPITLANVDQYLDHEGLFLPHDDGGHHTGPTPHEIDAAITNASNSLLQQEHDSSSLDHPSQAGVGVGGGGVGVGVGVAGDDGQVIDPSLMDDINAKVDSAAAAAAAAAQAQAGSSNGTGTAGPRTHSQAYKRRLLSEETIHHPQANIAPFIKPQRDAASPHPEQILFATRGAFEEWLKGESSWCHYVQRRVTNPEKRADERLKSRIRAHERALAAMTPEQAASAPPLKRRRRNRTSAVVEKVTYTCHHAGNYSSKHSDTLPTKKLRMNTKQSVKCSCSSRIVMTEVEGGECQVMYYWKHEGHDPFASAELEAGRLPKIVDEWLNEQVRQGATVDDIRNKLDMTDAERREYIRKATEDPSSVSPDMPPPLALSVTIKYPDIYNRFRKIRGAIKDIKVPKSQRAPRRRKAAGSASAGLSQGFATGTGPVDLKDESAFAGDLANVHDGDGHVLGEVDHHLVSNGEAPSMLHSEDVDHQFDEHLARLASDGQLAEALLRLPQGSGEGEHGGSVSHSHPQHQHHQGIGVGVGSSGLDMSQDDEVEENLRQAVLRMARAEREDWDSMVQQ